MKPTERPYSGKVQGSTLPEVQTAIEVACGSMAPMMRAKWDEAGSRNPSARDFVGAVLFWWAVQPQAARERIALSELRAIHRLSLRNPIEPGEIGPQLITAHPALFDQDPDVQSPDIDPDSPPTAKKTPGKASASKRTDPKIRSRVVG